MFAKTSDSKLAAFGLLVACDGNSEKKQAGPKTIAEQYNEWYDSLTDEQKKEVEVKPT